MTEQNIQSMVVSLHSSNPKSALEGLLTQKEYHDLDPIKRAVTYIMQFGGIKEKKLAIQVAGVMKLGVE